MKKLLLLLLLYSSISYAQTDFTRIYHPIINEAELAIVDTSYHDALQFYKEAFANVEKPFAKDYYNAAICATMVGKLPVVFDYLEKIVEKGYLVKNFRKDAFFKNIADTCKQWADFEKKAMLIKPYFNTALRDTIQKINRSTSHYSFAPITADLRNYYKNHSKDLKWVPVDSLIILSEMPKNLMDQLDSLRRANSMIEAVIFRNRLQQILRIIDLNGYPDENTIGLNPQITSENKIQNYTSASYFLENTQINNILFASTFQQKIDNIDIMSMVKQAIRDGKTHPSMLKHLVNYSTEEPATMGRVLVVQIRIENNMNCPNENWGEKKEKVFWKKERSATMSETEINEKRLNLGFEKLDDAYKKAFFKAHATPFLIYGGSYQAELAYISNCDLIDKMIKGAVILR